MPYQTCGNCEYNTGYKCPERPRDIERKIVETEAGCDRAIVDGVSGRMVKGQFTSILAIMARINEVVRKS